jgi:hypothetical protein
MESGGSLPCSQKPAAGTYPDPAEYSPHPIYLKFILILSRTEIAFLAAPT